jgi:hypothetical protein
MTFAILGEHLVRYTEEEVLPRLDRALAELGPAPEAASAARPAPAADAGAARGDVRLPPLAAT